jgi:hypothetical protein
MNKIYYTIKGKTDGFGAQYQAMMSGFAFSKFKNYFYFHSPFISMEHNVNVADLNKFIGINNNELIKNNLLPQPEDTIIVKPIADEVHWSKTPSIYYTDKVLKLIRQYYYSTAKPDVGNIDIAVHVRRGDVDPANPRFTGNSFYQNLISSLKQKYPSREIIIFSEGELEDFKDFGLNKDQFRLNLDVAETFHSLVVANVLVTARSSFSYTSAILNENTVYYQDFWHKKLDHWLDISSLN